MRKTNSDLHSTGAALVDSDMYAAAQELGEGATSTVASTAIATGGADSIDLYFTFNGANASSAGTVTFYVATSYDGTNYDTVGESFAFALAASVAQIRVGNLDTRNARYIKVIKIINGDATYHVVAANVHAFALQ